MIIATCPHCHREMYSNIYNRHIARCTHNADIMRRAREIVTAEYGGEVMTQSNYSALAARHKLPTRQDMLAHFGGWAAFTEWAGCLSAYNPAAEWNQPAERLQRSTGWDWPQTFAVEARSKVYYHWTLGQWVAGQVLEIR